MTKGPKGPGVDADAAEGVDAADTETAVDADADAVADCRPRSDRRDMRDCVARAWRLILRVSASSASKTRRMVKRLTQEIKLLSKNAFRLTRSPPSLLGVFRRSAFLIFPFDSHESGSRSVRGYFQTGAK